MFILLVPGGELVWLLEDWMEKTRCDTQEVQFFKLGSLIGLKNKRRNQQQIQSYCQTLQIIQRCISSHH